MNCRWQALKLCLNAAVVVVIKIFHEFLFEVIHGIKFLQIEQFAFEQTEEVFHNSIVRTVTFPAHTLSDSLFSEHPLILLVLVLPSLVRMKNQIGSVRYLLKSLVQHGSHHTQNRSI